MKAATIAPTLLLLPFDVPEGFWDAVGAAYASTRRVYHTIHHIEHMLDELQRFSWPHPREIYLASVFHDAVYDVGATDNEARSAAFALATIQRWLPDLELRSDLIERLILLTARHGRHDPDDVDLEEALFLDCDMAILGAHPRAYDAYEDAVAAEYAPYCTPGEWAAGRAAFLETLLARPRIFLSEAFAGRREAQARANLQRALARFRS